MRWVLYVDMDAFYVSCELRARPDLVGQPVIVGPDPKLGPTRGVVLSASYEARKFGVRSALPVSAAARLCPSATWLPADFPNYERTSHEVLERLRRFADDVRPMSIDEACLSLETDDPHIVEATARRIQEDLRTTLNLPATVAGAPNRLVAKIATDQAKPAGVRVVPREGVVAFLAPLPVRSAPGVGPKSEERLAAAGFATLGDVARSPRSAVVRALGGFGEELRRLARGEYEDPPEPAYSPKSRSIERTLAEDADRLEPVEQTVREMARSLAAALDEERWRYQTVSVAVRWEDFARIQRSRTLPSAREGPGDLESTAARLLHDLWSEEQAGKGRRVRMLAVAAERLVPARLRSIPLDRFGEGAHHK